jgi:hypothetical protein
MHNALHCIILDILTTGEIENAKTIIGRKFG